MDGSTDLGEVESGMGLDGSTWCSSVLLRAVGGDAPGKRSLSGVNTSELAASDTCAPVSSCTGLNWEILFHKPEIL